MTDARPVGTRRVLRAAAIYGIAWLACLVLYWGSLASGGIAGGMIMGYTLLVLYGALPAISAISAFFIGRVCSFGKWRLAAPFALATLYELFIMATFDLSTALGLTNIATADAFVLALGFAPAALGLGTGWLCDKFAPAAS